MQVKAGVFDRIGQSFVLLKNNFMDFFMPLFLYNLISVVVIGTIAMGFFFSNMGNIMNRSIDFFSFLNNSFVVISIAVGMVLFIVYLILYIPVLLGLIKGIKQASEGEEVTTMENLVYGFSRLTNSFKTYWYIFSYVALIPAMIFIIGGILFNAGFYFDGFGFFKSLGVSLMVLGGLLFLVFALYRGVKARFALYSAINHDNFKKDDFLNSVNITNYNWFRIVGNYLLLGLIISIVSGFIGGILKLYSYSGVDFTSIRNIDDIMNIASGFSIKIQILSGFLNNVLSTIGAVFVIIFTYLFFLRLKSESGSIANTGKIEL